MIRLLDVLDAKIIPYFILIFCNNIETNKGFPSPGNTRYKANTLFASCFCILNNIGIFRFTVINVLLSSF